MRFRRERDGAPEVNLTPLIDVVFLLLIFFMVSTTFERESEIAIELPEASSEERQEAPRRVEITIDAAGNYYVNGQALVNTQIATLKQALSGAAGDDETPRILLSADRKTPHESVITAMDAARQLGFVRLTFATRQPAEQ